jgi:hypothetical protein
VLLVPLKQWKCDYCGEVISDPKDGFLEWLERPGDDSKRARKFKIVHHAPKSPRQPNGDCYHYTNHPERADMHLDSFVAPDSMGYLLSFLDIGPMHDPEGKLVPRVENLREFTELMRRLTIPYYEEARLYWHSAEIDGLFEGASELYIYSPKTLRRIVESYGK